jgi:hypothetical protein
MVVEGEVAVEPLGMGYFYKSLDKLLHPIITVGVGAC